MAGNEDEDTSRITSSHLFGAGPHRRAVCGRGSGVSATSKS